MTTWQVWTIPLKPNDLDGRRVVTISLPHDLTPEEIDKLILFLESFLDAE